MMLRITTKFAQQCLISTNAFSRVHLVESKHLTIEFERCLLMYLYLNFMSLLIFSSHDVNSTVLGKFLKPKIYQYISQIKNSITLKKLCKSHVQVYLFNQWISEKSLSNINYSKL